MARPLRVSLADGWYHVFGRGIERRDIYRDDRDREHWLELLAEASERYRFRIHAYALMDNHYHAIVQTPDANLSQGMQWLHGSYGVWFNARHDRVGPLFQGRYRSVPVENGEWAYRLSFYVHLNPLRVAGLGLDRQGRVLEGKGWATPTAEQVAARVKQLRAYRWSSYRAYGGYANGPAWLEVDALLARAPGGRDGKRAEYRREAQHMLTRGVDAGLVERLRDAVAIGSRTFVGTFKAQAVAGGLDGIAGKRVLRRRMEADAIRRVVEKVKGEAWARFANRRGDWGCALFLWGAQRFCGLTLRELGQAAGGMKAEAVSKMISRFVLASRTDEALRDLQRQVVEMSSVHH